MSSQRASLEAEGRSVAIACRVLARWGLERVRVAADSDGAALARLARQQRRADQLAVGEGRDLNLLAIRTDRREG